MVGGKAAKNDQMPSPSMLVWEKGSKRGATLGRSSEAKYSVAHVRPHASAIARLPLTFGIRHKYATDFKPDLEVL